MALAWPHCVPVESPNLTETLQYNLELSLHALERARLQYVQSEARYMRSFACVSGHIDAAVLALTQPPPPVVQKTLLDVLLIWTQLGARLLGLGLTAVWLATQLVELWAALLALRLAFSFDLWWWLWRSARLPTDDRWFTRLLWSNWVISGAYLLRLGLIVALDWDLSWPPAVHVAWHSLLCALEWHELGRLVLQWTCPAEAHVGPPFTLRRVLCHFTAGVWANVSFLVLRDVTLWLLQA